MIFLMMILDWSRWIFYPPWGIQGSAARNALDLGYSTFLGGPKSYLFRRYCTWIHRARWFWGIFFVGSISWWMFQKVNTPNPGLVLIPRDPETGIMERYSQKLYVDSRKLDGMQLTYDIWSYHVVLLFLHFYITLCHVLSINIILYIYHEPEQLYKKNIPQRNKKTPNSARSKIPPQVHFEGIPFFPARGSRGDTSQL